MVTKASFTRSIFVFVILSLFLVFSAVEGIASDTVVIGHVTDTTGSSASEAPVFEAAREAGFNKVERIFDVQLLGGWLAQKID